MGGLRALELARVSEGCGPKKSPEVGSTQEVDCSSFSSLFQKLSKKIRAKDICGITLVSSDDFRKRDLKFYNFDSEWRHDLMTATILISYNSKWQNELEDQISKYFKSIARHV